MARRKTQAAIATVVGILLVAGVTTIAIRKIQLRRVDSASQLQKQMALSKLNDVKQLAINLLLYAENNRGQYPTNFNQISAYTNKNPVSVIGDFQIVYHGALNRITNRSTVIVVQESHPWKTTSSGWAKVYGFADGHSELHVWPGQWQFSLFEQQHSALPVSGQ